MNRFPVFLIILHHLSKVDGELWDGECGRPSPLPGGSCSDRDSSAICPEEVPYRHPWHMLLKSKLPPKDRKSFRYAVGTLIRVAEGIQKSDIVVTSDKACELFCKEGFVEFGAYDENTGTNTMRIDGCYTPSGVAGFLPCLVKLEDTVEFTDTRKPACVEKPTARVDKGSYGQVLIKEPNTRTSKGRIFEALHKVKKEEKTKSTFDIDPAKSASPGLGGSFLTKEDGGRYVMHGVHLHRSTAVGSPPFRFVRLAPYIANGWMQTTIEEHSALHK